MTTIGQEAAKYAKKGLKVFPLVPGGKVPITGHGFLDASSDLSQVKAWWEETPNANIGFPVPESLLVVDIDSDEALYELKANDADIPSTVTVKTPRGHHYWYSLPNGTKSKPKVAVFPGVDIRGSGSYVILPPSKRRDGAVYRWEVEPQTKYKSEAPDWVLELMGRGDDDGIVVSDPVHASEVLDGVGEGLRDITLFRYACQLRTRNMQKAEAEVLVLAAAEKCSPPFPKKDALRKLEQAWKYSVEVEEGVSKKPFLYTADSLIKAPLPEPIYLVQHIAPEGLIILVSPPKIGKSILASQICASVSQGGAALNELRTTKSSCLFLDLEQSEVLGKKRWKAILSAGRHPDAGPDYPKNLQIMFSWPLLDHGALDMLHEHLEEYPEIRVVVVDVLSKIWPEAEKKRGNAYHTEYHIMSQFKEFADSHRVSMILLHHATKAETSDLLHSASGTSAMTGVPDVNWFLLRKRGEKVAKLYVTGRSIHEKTYHLSWDYLAGGFMITDPEEMPT